MGLALVQRAWRRHYRLPLVWAAFLFFVVACSRGGGQAVPTAATPARQLGHEVVLSGNAVLACTAVCAERGLCGETPDRGQAVLLNVNFPAMTQADWAVSNNTAVVIEEARTETVVLAATGENQAVSFYRVNVPNRGSAWAAGWCVANTAAP